MPLSDRDLSLLRFEARWNGHTPAKEDAVRTELGISPARYYQLLERLIETEEALAEDPLLVHRLLRLRAQHDQERLVRAGVVASSAR